MTDLDSTLATIDAHLVNAEAYANGSPGAIWSEHTLLGVAVCRFRLAIYSEMLRYRWLRDLAEALIEREARILGVDRGR